MTEQQTTTYHYQQPGHDDLHVEVLGFASGLNTHPRTLFHSLPQGAPLPPAWITNLPQDGEEIESLAHEIANFRVSSDEQLTTDTTLFIKHFTKAFVEGYRFELYASTKGLLNLLYPVSEDERYAYTFAFAWELKLKEPAIKAPKDEQEARIIEGAETIQGIYKQYRRLN
jgi:hypothetical protein